MTSASDRLASHLSSSVEQLRERRKLGDHLDVPREVAHDGVFPTKEAALEAGKELMAEGYRTVVSAVNDQFLLEADKTTALNPDIVEQFTRTVFAAVDRNGGEYDGWGADLVDRPPRPLRAGFLFGYRRLFERE
jgi:hypothetical protein